MYLVRIAKHWFFVKLFFVLYFVSTRTSNNDSVKECPDDIEDDITWPRTSETSCSFSQPLCINNNFEITKRCCLANQTWETKSTCNNIQNNTFSHCPNGSIRKNNICIFVQKTVYPPNCPYEETLPFERYKKYVDANVFPIWLPIAREKGSYGEGLFLWKECSLQYKTYFTKSIHYYGLINNKNCLIFYNESYIEAVSCTETYSAVCAYSVLTQQTKSFCSQALDSSCKQSDYSTKSKCFCQKHQNTETNKIELLIPYQNLLYTSLDEVCYIALEKKNGYYIWTNSEEPINYTFWSANSNFGNEYLFGAMSSEGWLLRSKKEESSCSLIQKYPPPQVENEIVLSLSDDSTLVATIDNFTYWKQNLDNLNPMIFCFTDVYNDTIVQRISVKAISTGVEFSLLKNGPGNYWCEGFLYPLLEAKKSNVYYEESSYAEYVAILSTSYSKKEIPLSEEYVKQKYNLLVQNFEMSGDENLVRIFYPRVYKIVEINEATSKVTFNFHMTTKSNIQIAEIYSKVIKLLKKLHNFSFISLLSTSVCIGIQTISKEGNKFTWPMTNIGEVAVMPIEGWCIDKNGSIVTRFCGGNFIDGASWADMEENCFPLDDINPNLILKAIINLNNATTYLQIVLTLVSTKGKELKPLDIDLISQIFEQISDESSEVEILLFADLLQGLINLNQNLLRKSQQEFNSTDRMLYSIHKILKRSNFSKSVTTDSVSILSLNMNDFYSNSIFWVESDNGFTVKYVNFTDTEFLPHNNFPNFESGLIFDRDLLNEIAKVSNSRIIILAYFKGNLFNEEYLQRCTSTVFSVIFSNFECLNTTDLNNLITTAYNSENIGNPDMFSCSHWKEDDEDKKGYWSHKSKGELFNTIMLCNFKKYTHVGLVSTINITAQLKEFEEKTCFEKLNQINFFLIRYSAQFKDEDIYLITKIQMLCFTYIELISDIFDKLLDLPYPILNAAQKNFNINLLQIFNTVFKKYEDKDINIHRKNFAVSIIDPLLNNVNGFHVESCDIYCNIIVDKNENTGETYEINVNMDKKLIQQIINLKGHLFNKIIFVLFSNDILFVTYDYYKLKKSSKVVGIFLETNIGEQLSGSILINYEVEYDSHNHTCEIWQSNQWIKNLPVDPDVNNFYNCEFWKLGYYALRYNNLNLTTLIQEVIAEDLTSLETLEAFTNITDMYKKRFQALDIDLIATYLSNIKFADEKVLSECANVITNIMNFDKRVLYESETTSSSSSRLINSLNTIASKLITSHIVYTTKILIVVSFVKEQNISGIIINDTNDPSQFIPIVDQIPKNISSGILLSDDIIKELKVITYIEPIVIFTVYYSNSLFIEKYEQKTSNIIFGVHIPGYNLFLLKDIMFYFDKKKFVSKYILCVNWKFMEDSQEVLGTWELERHISKDLPCTYFKQGYFALVESNINSLNITKMLENINKSTETSSNKLEKLESIFTFYNLFKPYDIFMFSQCLIQFENLYINNVNIFLSTKMGINYFKIPNIIKQLSQIEYQATKSILDFVSKKGLLLMSNYPLEIENYFQIIRCNVDTSTYEINISKETLVCYSANHKETSIKVLYSQLSTHSIIASVKVFKENNLFVDEDESTTSKIVGISHSDNVDNALINIVFKQNQTSLPTFVCGSWEFVPNQNGKWVYIPTEKTHSETVCTVSNVRHSHYIGLVDQNFTKVLQDIYSSFDEYFIQISTTLNAINVFQNQLQPRNVYQIYRILINGEANSENHLQIIVAIINKLMDFDREILAAAQEKNQATENLLYCIDNLIMKFTGEKIILNHTNFAVIIAENIYGLVFDQSEELFYTLTDIIYDDEENLTPNTKLIIKKSTMKDSNKRPHKLYISIFFNNALFNGDYEQIGKKPGIIVRIVENTTSNDPLKFHFENVQNQSNVCAYWAKETIGNNIQTSYWKTIPEESCENRKNERYFALFKKPNVTNELKDLLDSKISLYEKLTQLIVIIQNHTHHFLPLDIFLISEILGGLQNETVVTKEHVYSTSQIISDLFYVNRTIMKESQYQHRATDSLLFTIDEAAIKCVDEIEDPIVYSNFTLLKTNIKDGNTSSIILNECSDTTCNIVFSNQTFDEIVEEKTFKAALVFSTELIERIKKNDGPVNLIVTVHFNNNFFNENPYRNMDTSQVLGVILQGLNKDLQGKIYFIHNMEDIYFNKIKSCAYWNYKVDEPSINGSWQNDASPVFHNGSIVCEHDHLTNFVLLLASSSSVLDELNNSYILDIVTNINSVLSLFGLFGILLTTVLFDRWRRNTGNQILINFSLAISIKNIMLYISQGIYTENNKSMACTITGGILQYSILSEFCWMLIIAILQFKRFVEVLGGPLKCVLLKACICGWVFPALPVFLIIIIDINNFNKSEIGLCYPSDLGLYLGVWLPLIVIVTINFIIFVVILYNVFHKKTEYREQVNHDIIFQWRLALLLFLMLGLTWSFGFLALMFESSLFATLFCFLATLQGFIMFLFFIVFNKNSRHLYIQCFNTWMYSKGYKKRLN